MLDKAFYEEEVKRLCLAFEQQVCFSIAEVQRNQFSCPVLIFRKAHVIGRKVFHARRGLNIPFNYVILSQLM